ncbi:MAG: RHS repeat-associated core domain-containing protein, partial [Bacteroidales bacterium]|nr:RHS repeat-associated core domain-containing protein [Bacteroidales bacterium]
YQMQAGVELNHDQFKDMVNSMLDDINHGQEKEVYFYHSDHLGSASWITDNGGLAVQHLQYLPYGERYVDQRASGYHERFTFTGKERDEETGYGYFGARYMDHELMTMWLSVDPMSDKYPNLSPYAYCAWNPIKLVDPDGEENIIYIVNLQKDKASIDVNKLINEANQRFENLGLETRVMLAPDGANFDPQYMDKTDSYAVIGSAFDVKKFISEKSGSETIDSWKGGTSNPERAENNYTKKGNYIAIDASGLRSVANNLGFDKIEMAALTILHGVGHNAGFNHSDNLQSQRRFNQTEENAAIMISGSKLAMQKSKGLNYIMNSKHNSKYIERMKTVFGTNKAQSNYEKNKFEKQARYIIY